MFGWLCLRVGDFMKIPFFPHFRRRNENKEQRKYVEKRERKELTKFWFQLLKFDNFTKKSIIEFTFNYLWTPTNK